MPSSHPVLHRSLRTVPALCFAAMLGLLVHPDAAASASAAYPYLSPTPGSQHVSPHNNIVVRSHRDLDVATLKAVALTVAGARSGLHDGKLTLSDDGKTLIFRPTQPFALGEEVNVWFSSGIEAHHADLPPVSFTFKIANADPERQPRLASDDEPADHWAEAPNLLPATTANAAQAGSATKATLAHAGSTTAATRPRETAASSVPASYPPITIFNASDPEPGHLFLTPNSDVGHLVIMDNRGYPIFYRRNPSRAVNFTVHPDGSMTYFNFSPPRFYRIDADWAVIRTVAIAWEHGQPVPSSSLKGESFRGHDDGSRRQFSWVFNIRSPIKSCR